MIDFQIFDNKIDFHNFGEISKEEVGFYLDQFISENLSLGNFNLLIITGKGSVIRPEVLRLLKRDKRIENFKSGGYFNGQEGAFEIKLKTISKF